MDPFSVLVELSPLTVEDQDRIIAQQLEGNKLYSNLQAFANVRSELDKVYRKKCTPIERKEMESIPQLDLFRVDGVYDPSMHQCGPSNLPLRKFVDSRNPRSTILHDLNKKRHDGDFPRILDKKLKTPPKDVFESLFSEDLLWEDIVADTDELFIVAETVKDSIESFFRDVGSKAGLEMGKEIKIGRAAERPHQYVREGDN